MSHPPPHQARIGEATSASSSARPRAATSASSSSAPDHSARPPDHDGYPGGNLAAPELPPQEQQGTQLLAVDDNLVGDDLLLPRTFGGQCPPAPLRKPRGNEELEATLSVFKLPETEFEKCKRTGRIRYKRDGERRASAPGEMETGSGGGSPSTPGRAGATGHQSQSSSGPSGSPDPAVKEKVQQDTIFWEMAEDGYLQPAPKEESGQRRVRVSAATQADTALRNELLSGLGSAGEEYLLSEKMVSSGISCRSSYADATDDFMGNVLFATMQSWKWHQQ